MSIAAYIIATLFVLLGLFTSLFVIKASKLNKALDEIAMKKIELSIKQSELEAIRDIQKQFKKTEEEKAPQKKPSPPAGDSSSRIERLNSLPDNCSHS